MKNRLVAIIVLVALSLACGVATSATMSKPLMAKIATASATNAPTLAATIAPLATVETVFIANTYHLRANKGGGGITSCFIENDYAIVVDRQGEWIQVEYGVCIGWIYKENVK